MPHPENSIGHSFIIKGKVGRRKTSFLLIIKVDAKLPSSATWVGRGIFFSYMISWSIHSTIETLFRSQYNDGLSFEMSSFHKLLLLWMQRNLFWGVYYLTDSWQDVDLHSTIVSLLGGMFSCFCFVVLFLINLLGFL